MTHVPTTEIALIERWIKHSISVRLSVHWPLLHEVFRPDLTDRIERVTREKQHCFSAPWIVRFATNKTYYYPGSLEDYIYFVWAVLRCRSAISQAKEQNSGSIDVGPPSAIEIAQGDPGQAKFLGQYWLKFERHVNQNAYNKSIVVHADVRRFFSSIKTPILTEQLLVHQAPVEAIKQLRQVLDFWKSYDCRGLPFLYASWPLSNLYLSTVDAELKKSGASTVRLGDDFRLICRNTEESQESIQTLTSALERLGLTLATEKTWIEQLGSRADNKERNRRTRQGIMKHGFVQPLLAQTLQYRILQPISTALLPKFRFPCHRANQQH